MNTLKKILVSAIMGCVAVTGVALNICTVDEPAQTTQACRDVYDFTMKLDIPRIYDNAKSLGYRKYQKQIIHGHLTITYNEDGTAKVSVDKLTNKTQKGITYKCTVGEDGYTTRVYVIGSNKTEVFNTASVAFSLDAEPSYNKGEDDEDNSLLITLSGHGKCAVSKDKTCQYIKTLKGTVAGTLGCGCYAYGHKSPTRKNGCCGPTDIVVDVAAVSGTWTAKYNKDLSCSSCNK